MFASDVFFCRVITIDKFLTKIYLTSNTPNYFLGFFACVCVWKRERGFTLPIFTHVHIIACIYVCIVYTRARTYWVVFKQMQLCFYLRLLTRLFSKTNRSPPFYSAWLCHRPKALLDWILELNKMPCENKKREQNQHTT